MQWCGHEGGICSKTWCSFIFQGMCPSVLLDQHLECIIVSFHCIALKYSLEVADFSFIILLYYVLLFVIDKWN